MKGNAASRRSQSSLELLITLSFGLIILLPIITLAAVQVSNSSTTLSITEAQQAANKLAAIAVQIGAQGYPARQIVTLQVPEGVQGIYVGSPTNSLGNEVIFIVGTGTGQSYVTAYSPINISGYLPGIQGSTTYLLNVSAELHCPADLSVPCVFIKMAG